MSRSCKLLGNGVVYEFRGDGASCYIDLVRLALIRWMEPRGAQFPGLSVRPPLPENAGHQKTILDGLEQLAGPGQAIVQLLQDHLGPISAWGVSGRQARANQTGIAVMLPADKGGLTAHELLEIPDRLRAALIAAGAAPEAIAAALQE